MRRLTEVLEDETGESQTVWSLFRTPFQWVAAVLGSALVESLISNQAKRIFAFLVFVLVAVLMFFLDKRNRPVGTAILLRGWTGEHQEDLWNKMRSWVTKPFRYVYQFSTPLPKDPAQWAAPLEQLANQLAVSLDPNQGGPIDRNARKSVLLNMPITCAFWLGSQTGNRQDKLEVFAEHGDGFDRIQPAGGVVGKSSTTKIVDGRASEGLAIVFLVHKRVPAELDILAGSVKSILVIERSGERMNGAEMDASIREATLSIEDFVGKSVGRVKFLFDGPVAMAFSLGQRCRLFANRFDLMEHDRATNTYQKIMTPGVRL